MLSLKLPIILNTKLYSRKVLGILSSPEANPRKKKSIMASLNKIYSKINLVWQSNLFLQSFLIQSLSIIKISNMILTKFKSKLQFYSP